MTQYLALRAMAREGVSGTELARRAGVSSPAVSQLLAGLADAALIERQPVAEQRRRQALALTAAGEHPFRSAEALLRRRLGTLLQELPPRGRRARPAARGSALGCRPAATATTATAAWETADAQRTRPSAAPALLAGSLARQIGEQCRHLLERQLMLRDVVVGGQLTRIPVAERNAFGVRPNDHA